MIGSLSLTGLYVRVCRQERLDETRMLKFMVKWHTGGMDVKHSEHKQFVEDLCAQFSPLIISVIDNVLSEDESKVRGHCRPLAE